MRAKLRGVPLRLVEWSETSQIVTLLTDKMGKVTAMAKGAHRPKSAFDGPFDLLSHYEVILLRGPRARVGQFTESFQHSRPELFRQDLQTQRLALSCIERSRELTEEEEPGPYYQELVSALGRMVQGEDPIVVHNDFSIRMLMHQGLGPVTRFCVINGQERETRAPVFYSARYGGILSPAAISHDPEAQRVKDEILERIRSAQELRLDESPLADKDEAMLTRLITLTVQHAIGKPLRMARYLSMLLVFFLSACGDSPPAQELFDSGLASLEAGSSTWGRWDMEELEEEYPENPLVPEGLWLVALDHERNDKISSSIKVLGRLLDGYPDSRHFDRSLKKRFELLETVFLEGREIDNGRVRYSVGESILDDMESIASKAPYSPLADRALMYVADAHYGNQDFDVAETLYKEVLSRMDRDSPLEVRAQFQLALCHWDRAVVRVRGFFDRHLRNPLEPLSQADRLVAARYSSSHPIEAKNELKEVIRRFPDSKEAKMAIKITKEINEIQASRLLSLGDFYRFYGKIGSADYYYTRTFREYPGSDAARIAQEKVVTLNE